MYMEVISSEEVHVYMIVPCWLMSLFQRLLHGLYFLYKKQRGTQNLLSMFLLHVIFLEAITFSYIGPGVHLLRRSLKVAF